MGIQVCICEIGMLVQKLRAIGGLWLAKILNPVKLRKSSLTALMKTAAEVLAEIC